MPLPTVNDVHVDRLLTNVSVGYTNAKYIADQIFPMVPVQKQSDLYVSYDQSFWFRDEAALRAPGTLPKESGYGITTSNQYICVEYALAKRIPDEARANADAPINLDTEATEFLTDKIMLRRESQFVTDFFTTSVWGTDKTGGTDFTVWSNYAGSNPIVDVDDWKNTVRGKIGRNPNVMAVGAAVRLQLKNHPDLLDTIKYTQTGVVTDQLIANLFGLEKFLVGDSINTTAKEGTAESSVTYSDVWGKHALLVYVPSSPSLLTPSAGYTFVWQVIPQAFQYVMRHRDERPRADIITVGSYFDQKLTASNAGLFASGAVA